MKPKRTHTDANFLADQIDAIATLMWALSERMEYYAGFNGKMNLHAREMAGASSIARTWSQDAPKPPAQQTNTASCETCRFLLTIEQTEERNEGGILLPTKLQARLCRRFPIGEKKAPHDWCGEWRELK